MSLTFHRYIPWQGIITDTAQRFTFPAGEAAVKIESTIGYGEVGVADLRGCDSHELLQLAMWAYANAHRERVLLLPYLPGSRDDRGHAIGATVYAKLINSMGFERVVTIDPHSHHMPQLINNLTVVDPVQMMAYTVDREGLVGVIAPDAGAVARASTAALALGVPLIQATKVRDQATGKLSGFDCPDLEPGNYLVVDDICDGGGTFNGLADVIFDKSEDVRLDLWVTHGIFSKGLDELLADRFDSIYTTDSYPSGPAKWPGLTTGHRLTATPALPAMIGAIDFDNL